MSKEFKTGAVAIFVVALFIWGYSFLKGQNLFEGNSRQFFIEYNNIQGLNKASAVTISGLKVGRIVGITFNANPEKKGKIIVEISLDGDFEFTKKTIARIYAASLMGGQNLAIIPSYEGERAVTGDYLKGEVEQNMFSSVSEKLNPLQSKVENVIVSADSLLLGINQILNKNSRESLQRSIVGLEETVAKMNEMILSVSTLVDSSKSDIAVSLENTKRITDNFAKLSDTLVDANLGLTIKKIQTTIENVDAIIAGIESGKGSLGKLVTDDEMYNNLTKASKEMEELLREMKLHPKRFVHFSLFGKKEKPYTEVDKK